MAKKAKDDAPPNPNSVTNRDIIQRLSYLYQASVYLNSINSPPTASGSNSDANKGSKKRRKTTLGNLSKSYIDSMKVVGNRTTVKMCVTFADIRVDVSYFNPGTRLSNVPSVRDAMLY